MLKINEKEIPKIAIGTWAWGSGINGSRMIFGESVDKNELKKVFDISIKNGFNLWDTAAVYGMGNAEKILGEFSKEKEILISTKYTPGKKYSSSKIDKTLNESVKRLNGKIPDIYFLHNPLNLELNIKHLIQLLKSKKIASVGVSNFNLEQIKKADNILKQEGFNLAAVQNHFSLIYRKSEEDGIIDWCKEKNIPFFGYMVLEQGVLTGKYTKEHGFSIFSRRGIAFPKKRLKKIEPLIELLKEIGKKYEISVANTATVWAISKNIVPIIGITKAYQAKEIEKIKNIKLDENEINILEEVAEKTGVKVAGSWE